MRLFSVHILIFAILLMGIASEARATSGPMPEGAHPVDLAATSVSFTLIPEVMLTLPTMSFGGDYYPGPGLGVFIGTSWTRPYDALSYRLGYLGRYSNHLPQQSGRGALHRLSSSVDAAVRYAFTNAWSTTLDIGVGLLYCNQLITRYDLAFNLAGGASVGYALSDMLTLEGFLALDFTMVHVDKQIAPQRTIREQQTEAFVSMGLRLEMRF